MNSKVITLVVFCSVSVGAGAFIASDMSGQKFHDQVAQVDQQLVSTVEKIDERLQYLETELMLVDEKTSQMNGNYDSDAPSRDELQAMILAAVQEAHSESQSSLYQSPYESEVYNDPQPPHALGSDGQIIKNARDESPILIVNPSPEQNQIFEDLKLRLDDPNFINGITFSGLIEMEEMKSIPDGLRKVIISKVIAKVNSGEIDSENFIRGSSSSFN